MLFRIKNYLPILFISTLLAYAFFTYIDFIPYISSDIRPGVRINYLNFIKGIFCSAFAFALIKVSHIILTFILGNYYNKQFREYFLEKSSTESKKNELTLKEILNKALFNCAFEELLFRVVIFAAILEHSNFYIASATSSVIVYLSYLQKKNFLPALLLVFYSLFANKLYYTHESYFLIATCNFFFWLSWLLFINTELHNKISDKTLSIRKKIFRKKIRT